MSDPNPFGRLAEMCADLEQMEHRQFLRFMADTLTRNPDGTTTIKRPVRYVPPAPAQPAPAILEDW